MVVKEVHYHEFVHQPNSAFSSAPRKSDEDIIAENVGPKSIKAYTQHFFAIAISYVLN